MAVSATLPDGLWDSRKFWAAIGSATPDFQLGAVGAGRGTICYGFKGGIGSASRVLSLGDKSFTLGVLVQTNFGAPGDLRILGKPAQIPSTSNYPGPVTPGPSW